MSEGAFFDFLIFEVYEAFYFGLRCWCELELELEFYLDLSFDLSFVFHLRCCLRDCLHLVHASLFIIHSFNNFPFFNSPFTISLSAFRSPLSLPMVRCSSEPETEL